MDGQNTQNPEKAIQKQSSINESIDNNADSVIVSVENAADEPALVTEYVSDWISLKDYANELGISYEAVRQQVNKKQSELEGHIKNIGKTRFLDEEARKILSSKKPHTPRLINKPSTYSITENTISEHTISVVDIRRDMFDDRWTIDDYRNRIKQLEDEKRDLESEYEMLKSLLASMNMAEFRSWKRQQKKEWNDKFLSRTDY